MFRKGRHPFRLWTFDRARRDLEAEIQRIGGAAVVLSTNVPLRNDGKASGVEGARTYEDPGVAVYFKRAGKRMVMAMDAHETVAANVRALSVALNHLRGMERHGGAHMMERVFEGFKRLTHTPARGWREVLGVEDLIPTERTIREAFRRRAAACHPDQPGGDEAAMIEATKALDDALAELEGVRRG